MAGAVGAVSLTKCLDCPRTVKGESLRCPPCKRERERSYSRTYNARHPAFCCECSVQIDRHHKLCRGCASRRQWDRRRYA